MSVRVRTSFCTLQWRSYRNARKKCKSPLHGIRTARRVAEQRSSAKERRRIARYVSGELDSQRADKKTVRRAANEASHIWWPLTKWKSTGKNGVQAEAPVCELDFSSSCSCGRLGEQRALVGFPMRILPNFICLTEVTPLETSAARDSTIRLCRQETASTASRAFAVSSSTVTVRTTRTQQR